MKTHLPMNQVGSVERERLVRLCARLSGDPDVAEDLAQETLLVAWHHQHDLRDPERRFHWLCGIARNVCLRWLRKRGRELERMARSSVDRTLDLPDEVDLELELERGELAALLDRALALLPPETRDVLVGRYIDELSTSEMATRLDLQPGMVAVRLHRGKLALRRVLTGALGDEAISYGLVSDNRDGFQQTSIWCFLCGRRRLAGYLDSQRNELILRCDACCNEPRVYVTHSELPGVFVGVSRYRAAYSRAARFLHRYNWQALEAGTATCLGCGHRVTVSPVNPEDYPLMPRGEHGVFSRCPSCGAVNQSPLRYMVLGMPEFQRFWREHPRLRLLPERAIEAGGQPALLFRAESMAASAHIEALCAADTYRVLSVETGSSL